ncbi:lipoprotein [Escherichia coli H263]|nr:lipoprotein [Escherichia coli H263]
MKKRFLSLSGLLMLSLSCLPLTAGAAVVLYTTQDDALPQTDIPFEVVYLDAPERLLDEALLQPGTELSEADRPAHHRPVTKSGLAGQRNGITAGLSGRGSGLAAGGVISAGGRR